MRTSPMVMSTGVPCRVLLMRRTVVTGALDVLRSVLAPAAGPGDGLAYGVAGGRPTQRTGASARPRAAAARCPPRWGPPSGPARVRRAHRGPGARGRPPV